MKKSTPTVQKYLKQHQQLYGDTLFVMTDQNHDRKNNLETQEEPHQLTDYFKKIRDCTECQLSESRTNFVFGSGNPDADIVFVGEAPGKNEDLQGIPFIGRAGKLLDKILEAIQLSRKDVFILNVLKCRPPNNRDPLSSEVEKCEPYLKKQLDILKPKLIVCLGRISGKTLLRLDMPLGKMRENMYSYNGIDAMVTYHPAALLRNPNLKKAAWEDFQMIRDKYILAD